MQGTPSPSCSSSVTALYTKREIALIALLLSPLLAGCQVVCTGPTCETLWSAGRIAIVRGDDWTDAPLDPWDHADWTWSGASEDGTDFAVAHLDGELLIGQPDARRVLRARADLGVVTAVGGWSEPEEGFGAVLSAGDVDGDGLDDLWVGAPGARLGRGDVWLYRSDGPDGAQTRLHISGLTAGDRLGSRISRCGDLTGDGLPEWLISAPRFSRPASGPLAELAIPDLAGAVFLLGSERLAGASGTVALAELAARAWWGSEAGAGAGAAVSCDRDLDGDGVADLVIGAPWHGSDTRGEVYVLGGALLPDSGPLSEAASRVLAGAADDWLGASLVAGDFDGDGKGDLVIGAPGWGGGSGRALLFDGLVLSNPEAVGRARTVFALPRRVRRANEPVEHFGRTLAKGDLNGDGLDDLLVGTPDWSDDGRLFGAGLVSIWFGAPGAQWSSTEVSGVDDDQQLRGTQTFQRVGRRIDLLDVDGDGRDDLVLPMRLRPRL